MEASSYAPALAREALHAQARPSALARLARAYGLTVAVALAVFGLAFSNGTFGVTARDTVGIAVWWLVALAVGIAVFPLARVPRPALAAGGALAAFAALSAASIAWADNAEGAFDEAGRALLYLGVFALVVTAARRGSIGRWSDGLGLGIAALGVFALTARLFPHLIPSATSSALSPDDPRPSYPVNYWNGLAVLMAVGFPPLLRVAGTARRPAIRAAAIAPLPAMAAVIYLTSSRGGVIALFIACAAFLAFTSDRLKVAVSLGIAGIGGALAIVAFHGRPNIVDGPIGSPAAASEGRTAALLILGVCVAAGVAQLLLSRVRLSIRVPRLGEVSTFFVGAAVVIAATVAIVAANPYQRFESFKQAPQYFTGGSYTSRHLASDVGSGRWQFWQAAVKQFDSKPLTGRGAGSYQTWWDQHGTLRYVVRDAHSLYVQSLGELGIGGLGLILALIGVVAVTTAKRLRAATGRHRGAVASVAAVALAFAFSAGIDWMWQLTVAGAIGIAAFALLVGPASLASGEEAPRVRRLSRAGVVALAFVAIAAMAIPLLAQTDVRASQASSARGEKVAALKHAQDARGWQPWAASTQLQVALAESDLGNVTAAKSAIAKAIARDPSDWRLYVVSAQIDRKAGNEAGAGAALAHAKRLNPRSDVLASIR